MIVKRYYAESMTEAMATIRAELGPDAVILSSKPVKSKGLFGFLKKKQLEVIAAYEPRLESPRTREERETGALNAALRAAKQEGEAPVAIPPAPGIAMGPAARSGGQPAVQGEDRPPRPLGDAPVHPQGMPAVMAPGRAATAYKNAVTTAGPVMRQQSEEARQALAVAPTAAPVAASAVAPQAAGDQSIQQALEVALAARKAALEQADRAEPPRQSPPRPPQAPGDAREERIRRESEHFIPLNPPEMVIMPAKGEMAQEKPPQPPAAALPEERLEALEKRLLEMTQIMGAVAGRIGEGDVPLSDEGRAIYRKLEENDVEEKLARALAREAQELAPRIGGTVRDAALRVLLREMRESAPLQFQSGRRSVLVFMGPTGVGKTTTLVKLATMCAVRNGLKVGMINTDTYRIAAQEQLRIYADILDVAQSVVYSPAEMREALDQMADRDVVFVDTAGKRPGDVQHREDMQALMRAAGSEARAMLCVAAPTGPKALKGVIRHYEFLDDYGLILTKADEIEGWGAAVNACSFSQRNLNYLTAGQSVPDDIEEADARVIVERLLC